MMAEQLNNGGPAFPRSESLYPDGTVSDPGALGATLRDYFAAKAMAVVWTEIPDDVDRDRALRRLGNYAYEMADAMLKAREGGAS